MKNSIYWHKKYGFVQIKDIKDNNIIFEQINLKKENIFFNSYLYFSDKQDFLKESYKNIFSFFKETESKINTVLDSIYNLNIKTEKDVDSFLFYVEEINKIISNNLNFIKDLYFIHKNEIYADDYILEFDFLKFKEYISNIVKKIFKQEILFQYFNFLADKNKNILNSSLTEKFDYTVFIDFFSAELDKKVKLKDVLIFNFDEYISDIIKKFLILFLFKENDYKKIFHLIHFIYKTYSYKDSNLKLTKKEKIRIDALKSKYFYNDFSFNIKKDINIDRNCFIFFMKKYVHMIKTVLIKKKIKQTYPLINENVSLFVQNVLIKEIIPHFLYSYFFYYPEQYNEILNELKKLAKDEKNIDIIYILNDVLSVGNFMNKISTRERLNLIKNFKYLIKNTEEEEIFFKEFAYFSFFLMSDHTAVMSLKYFKNIDIKQIFKIMRKNIVARMLLYKSIYSALSEGNIIDYDKNVLLSKRMYKILIKIEKLYLDKESNESVFVFSFLEQFKETINSPFHQNNLFFLNFFGKIKDNIYYKLENILQGMLISVYNFIFEELFDLSNKKFLKIRKKLVLNTIKGIVENIKNSKNKDKIIEIITYFKYQILKKEDMSDIFSLKNREYSLFLLSIDRFSFDMFEALSKSVNYNFSSLTYLRTNKINNFEKNLFEITDKIKHYEYNVPADLKIFIKIFEQISFLNKDIFFNILFIRNFIIISFFYFKSFADISFFEEKEAESTEYMKSEEKAEIMQIFFNKINEYFNNSVVYYLKNNDNPENLYFCLNLLKENLKIKKERKIMLTINEKRKLNRYELNSVISIYRLIFDIYLNGITYIDKNDIKNIISLFKIDDKIWNTNDRLFFEKIFINPGIFNLLFEEKEEVKNIIKKYRFSEKEVLLYKINSFKKLYKKITDINKILYSNTNIPQNFNIKRTLMLTENKIYFSYPFKQDIKNDFAKKTVWGNYITLNYIFNSIQKTTKDKNAED